MMDNVRADFHTLSADIEHINTQRGEGYFDRNGHIYVRRDEKMRIEIAKAGPAHNSAYRRLTFRFQSKE